MTTSEAVAMLRRRLGDSQRAFAKRLGTTVTTISRYERARIGISEEMLLKLADVAKTAGLIDLQNFFTSQRNLAITARVESLPSLGAQRRVSVSDLARWRAMADLIADKIHEARKSMREIVGVPPEHLQRLEGTSRLLSAIENNIAKDLAKLIDLYIDTQPQKGKTQ